MANDKIGSVQGTFGYATVDSLARLIARLRLRLWNRNRLRFNGRNSSRDVSWDLWDNRLRNGDWLWNGDSRNLNSWKQCSQVTSIN
jgi:hypothetical protein